MDTENIPRHTVGPRERQEEATRPHRWLPGESGNPGGRPKKLSITEHLRKQLDTLIPDSMCDGLPPDLVAVFGDRPTYGQMIAFKMIERSLAKGDILHIKEILERTEGKVVQKTIELTQPLSEKTDDELEAEIAALGSPQRG